MGTKFDANTAMYLAFYLVVILASGAGAYFKIIDSQVFSLLLGGVVGHGFGTIPTSAALKENTLATRENTATTVKDTTQGETTHG